MVSVTHFASRVHETRLRPRFGLQDGPTDLHEGRRKHRKCLKITKVNTFRYRNLSESQKSLQLTTNYVTRVRHAAKIDVRDTPGGCLTMSARNGNYRLDCGTEHQGGDFGIPHSGRKSQPRTSRYSAHHDVGRLGHAGPRGTRRQRTYHPRRGDRDFVWPPPGSNGLRFIYSDDGDLARASRFLEPAADLLGHRSVLADTPGHSRDRGE